MRRLLTIALLIMLPIGVRGQEVPESLRVLMCEFVDESGTGWVADFLMLTRQTQGPYAGRIEVYDTILKDLVGYPIQAVVTADDGRRRTYGWALGKVQNHSGQRAARLDYRLTIRLSDLTAELVATPQGYGSLRGSGQCADPDG